MAKTRNSNVPANETKEQKSLRLAKARMPKALKAINAIGNLAGSGYSYTDKQKEKMTGDLLAAVERVSAQFKGKVASDAGEYEL